MERQTSQPRKISGMEPGERASVLGTVVEKDRAGFFVLDDGESKATVLVPSDSMLENVLPGDLVRVIGRVIEKSEIKAEIIQKMKGIDTEIYFKYLELRNKFKSSND